MAIAAAYVAFFLPLGELTSGKHHIFIRKIAFLEPERSLTFTDLAKALRPNSYHSLPRLEKAMPNISFKSLFTPSANSKNSASVKQDKHAGQQTDHATASTSLSESERAALQNISKKDRGATFLRWGRRENRHANSETPQVQHDMADHDAKSFESAILNSLQREVSGKQRWSAMKKNATNALAMLQNLNSEQIERLPSEHRAALGTALLNIHSHVQEQDAKIGNEITELRNARNATFNPLKVRARNQGLKNMELAKKTLGEIRGKVDWLFGMLSEDEKLNAKVGALPENEQSGFIVAGLREQANILRKKEDILQALDERKNALANSLFKCADHLYEAGNQNEKFGYFTNSLSKQVRFLRKSRNEQLDSVVSSLKKQIGLLSDLDAQKTKLNSVAKSLDEQADLLRRVDPQNEQLDRVAKSLSEHAGFLREVDSQNEKLSKAVKWLRAEANNWIKPDLANRLNIDNFEFFLDEDVKLALSNQKGIWEKQKNLFSDQKIFLRNLDSKNKKLGSIEESLSELISKGKEIVDLQNSEQTDVDVAKKITDLFSASAKRGFDLSNELSNDEVVYLTRSMMAFERQSEEKGLSERGDKVAKVLDSKSGKMKEDFVTSVIRIGSDKQVRQTAELLHKGQLQSMLGRLATPEEHLKKAAGHLESHATDEALREITEAINALEKVDKSEVSRLYKHDGSIDQYGKGDIARQLDRIEESATSIIDALELSRRGESTTSGKRLLEQIAEWSERVRQEATSLHRPAFNQYRFGDEVLKIEEKIVGYFEQSLLDMGKNTLTADEFNNLSNELDNLMRSYEEQGVHAIDEKFRYVLENPTPDMSQATINALGKERERAKDRIVQSLKEVYGSAGWSRPQQEEGHLEWKKGPLLFKRGLSLQKLTLKKERIASGANGSVSIFENENGRKLIGKVAEVSQDDLDVELDAYRRIYDIAGPHPNLVNTYGIATVTNDNGEKVRMMFMDAVPGKNGYEVFDALSNAWNERKISSEKYWGAIQFIGRRLLDVTEHMGKAGVVHNDIKPDNFLVNKHTGELVVIDLGLWAKAGEKTHFNWAYSAPEEEQPWEAADKQGVDERSDVFKVGATLMEGIEKAYPERDPKQGLFKSEAVKDSEGNVVREKASYSAETAYTRFINSVMERNKGSRVNSQEAKNLPFLEDSVLDDETAKKVIAGVINPELAGIDTQKPSAERWNLQFFKEKRARTMSLLEAFGENLSLANYAKLRNESKTDPELKEFLNHLADDDLAEVKQDAAAHAVKLIDEALWFDDVKRILATVPEPVLKSGVDKNGLRLRNVHKKTDPAYELAATQAKKELSSSANMEDLRRYAVEAEAFLSDVGTSQGRIYDGNISGKVRQVRERMIAARRAVEIDALDAADEISEVETQVVGAIAEFIAKTGKNKLSTDEFDNMVKFYMNHGLNAIEGKFESALQNSSSEESRKNIESMRDSAKAHLMQSVYGHIVSTVEKQVASDLEEFFPKMGKKIRKSKGDNAALDYMDSMVQRSLNLTMQGYIKKGFKALDGAFAQAMRNILPGQSSEEFERIRDAAKDRIKQSVYENAFSIAEKQAIEDDAEAVPEMEKNSARPEFVNVAQASISDDLNGFDENIEHAQENILSRQSSEKLESTRESGEVRNIQSVYESTISMAEKQAVAHIVETLSKKDVITTPMLNTIVQDSINRGLNAFDENFEHVRQSPRSGQTSEDFEKTRDSAKSRLAQSINEACRAQGWPLPEQEQSKLEWESSAGPLLIKRGLSLQQLKLDKEDIASGNFGSVSIFENENGDKLIGKILKNAPEKDEQGNIIDELAEEVKAYQAIYDSVGPHPNIVNVYGIAQVVSNGEKKRALLMDAVLGKTGNITFNALRECWNTGKISSEEYWSAIQLISRRLLDVTEHIGKAGVVHNDIKPENFIVDEKTGEPVLIDFGVWSKKGEVANGGTGGFMSLEAAHQLEQRELLQKLEEAYRLKGEDAKEVNYPAGVDERSDVFAVGASLLAGVEGMKERSLPNKGLAKSDAKKDREGNVVREKAGYGVETAYTKFMNAIMAKNQADRANSEDAKNLDFLNDSMLLDEGAAKAVIKKSISLFSMEEKKPQNEQWKKIEPQVVLSEEEQRNNAERLVNEFTKNATLTNYAKLQNESKTNRGVKNYLLLSLANNLLDKVKQDMATRAKEYVAGEKYSWFDQVNEISKTVPRTAIKSGVDENGVSLAYKESSETVPKTTIKIGVDKKADSGYERSVREAKEKLSSHVNVEDLRQYADELEAFLREAGTFDLRKANRGISNSDVENRIQQVRERAAIARGMMEIVETDLSASNKPETGNIRDRASALERQLLDRSGPVNNGIRNRGLELESQLRRWPHENDSVKSRSIEIARQLKRRR